MSSVETGRRGHAGVTKDRGGEVGRREEGDTASQGVATRQDRDEERGRGGRRVDAVTAVASVSQDGVALN